MKKQEQKLSDKEFDSIFDERFVTRLSDGTEKELCKDGKEKRLVKANLEEYVSLLLETRIKETEMQIKAFKEGVYTIIPLEIIKILTWEEVEIRCCGDKIIDIAKLKGITEYSVIIPY